MKDYDHWIFLMWLVSLVLNLNNGVFMYQIQKALLKCYAFLFGNRKSHLSLHLPSIQCWGERMCYRFLFVWTCTSFPIINKMVSCETRRLVSQTKSLVKWQSAQIVINWPALLQQLKWKLKFICSPATLLMLLYSHAEPQSHFIQSKTPAASL